jgi:hypothetical protein
VVYPVVGEVYVYDSSTRVRILQLGDDLDGEDLLPGFRVGLATLFEEGDAGPEHAATAGDSPESLRGD